MNRSINFDENEIRRELKQKVPGLYEIRIIMTDFYGTKLSAYLPSDAPDIVISQIMGWNYPPNCCVNFYLSINPVKDYCQSREQYLCLRKSRVMTSLNDIDRITWFAVGIGSDHPAGTSATNAEKERSRQQAIRISEYMDNLGFSCPEVVDAGNGWQLRYRIDLPNTPEVRDRINLLSEDLHQKFPLTNRSFKDVAKVLTLPGTMVMSGRNTSDRPFRMARIIRESTMINNFNVAAGGEEREE